MYTIENLKRTCKNSTQVLMRAKWPKYNIGAVPGLKVTCRGLQCFFAQNSHDNLINQPVFSGKFFTPLIYNFGMRITLPTDFLGISNTSRVGFFGISFNLSLGRST